MKCVDHIAFDIYDGTNIVTKFYQTDDTISSPDLDMFVLHHSKV